MNYFRDATSNVWGYDPATQGSLISAAQAAGWVDVSAAWPPPPTVPAPPTVLTSWVFLNRFTALEQIAVQAACNANIPLQVCLTQALADGAVDLSSTAVATWMGALVAANAITAARSAVILTP